MIDPNKHPSQNFQAKSESKSKSKIWLESTDGESCIDLHRAGVTMVILVIRSDAAGSRFNTEGVLVVEAGAGTPSQRMQ